MPKPKRWEPGQAKKFARELKLGHTYYVVYEINTKGRDWADPYRATSVVFTGRLPFTGNPCTDTGYSAETWCQLFGPVYDTRPDGVRLLDEPAPQFPPNAAAANPGGFINVNF